MGFESFGTSALVVAHPDDEVLWFSSVAGKVARVIIAYEDCDDLPELGAARRRAAERYPLANAVFLRLPEPCSLGRADWSRPVATEYGMAMNNPEFGDAEPRYRAAYAALRERLAPLLRGMSHVFTHNAWGEYGHPDHVQVSRVVGSLAPDLNFTPLHSSYIAPRSMGLAAQCLPALEQSCLLETDGTLADRIKRVYVESGCWTWHSAYSPPPAEAFFAGAQAPTTEADSLQLTCLMTT